MDDDGYLRRFIDYRFPLLQPSAEGFSQFLFERFSMSEALKGRSNPHNEKETLIRVFSRLAQRHKFSLRKIEQCFTEMNLVLRIVPKDILLFPEMLAFLVALKNYDNHSYFNLRQNMPYTEMKKIIETIGKDFDLTDRDDFRRLARINASLIVDYLDRYADSRAYDQAIKDLEPKEGDTSIMDKSYSTQVLQIIQNAEQGGRYIGLKYTVSRLDLIEGLTINK